MADKSKKTSTLKQATRGGKSTKAFGFLSLSKEKSAQPNSNTPQLPSAEERESKCREMRMSWFPRPRNNPTQGFTTDSKEGRTCVLHDDVIYLFGGYSPCMQQANFEAFSLVTRQMSVVKAANREPWLRAHHSCTLFEDYLVIFGGEAYSGSADNKMLTSEVLIYSIKKNEFLRVPTNQPVEPRKHHAAALIGSHLIISGGIDEDLKPVGLLQTFHLKTYHWKSAPIGCSLPVRANHAHRGLRRPAQNPDHRGAQEQARLARGVARAARGALPVRRRGRGGPLLEQPDHHQHLLRALVSLRRRHGGPAAQPARGPQRALPAEPVRAGGVRRAEPEPLRRHGPLGDGHDSLPGPGAPGLVPGGAAEELEHRAVRLLLLRDR